MAIQVAKREDTPPSNEALLLEVGLKRDRAAFRQLFDYFAPRIKSFLMKGGARPDQAEELAQETMLAVWARAESFDPKQAAASTWIFTIARNKRIDALRKFMRVDPDPNDPAFAPVADASVDDVMIAQQQTASVRKAMTTLPADQSRLLIKSFFENKSHAEIAAETRLPLGTVKSRIRLAVEKLRYAMQKNGEG